MVLCVCVEDAQQLFLHDDLGLRVERGERLVHQQDRPLHDQRARQRDALAHAAGQLAGQVLLEAAQSDRGNERARALVARGLGHAAHLQAEGDIVDDAAPGKQVEVLPHHHRVGAERMPDIVALRVLDPDRAAGRAFEPGDDLDQRALAAPARPEQAGDAPRAEAMGEVIERDHAGAAKPRPDLRHLVDDDVHAVSMPRMAQGE